MPSSDRSMLRSAVGWIKGRRSGPGTPVAPALASLPFDLVTDATPVVLQPVDLPDFPAVRREEWFGRMQTDRDVFDRALRERLEPLLPGQVETIVLHRTRPSPRLVGFAFLAGRQVCPLRIEGPAEFAAWLEAMTEEMPPSVQLILRRDGSSLGSFPDADTLDDAPARLLLDCAPRSYAGDDRAAERAAYLSAQARGGPESCDPGVLDQALADFIAARGIEPADGADPAELEALEAALGSELPQSFRQVWSVLDGQPGAVHGYDLMSVAQCRASWHSWTLTYADWSLAELTDDKAADPGVLPLYCCPGWLPIVDLVGGHYLALDLTPAEGGRRGQVILSGRDLHTNRLIAPDLAALLREVADYDGSPGHRLHRVLGELDLS